MPEPFLFQGRSLSTARANDAADLQRPDDPIHTVKSKPSTFGV